MEVHLGCKFTDVDGSCRRCFQFLNEDGNAEMTADFRDWKCERALCSRSYQVRLAEFLFSCTEIIKGDTHAS